jgi:hypothetical protein
LVDFDLIRQNVIAKLQVGGNIDELETDSKIIRVAIEVSIEILKEFERQKSEVSQ